MISAEYLAFHKEIQCFYVAFCCRSKLGLGGFVFSVLLDHNVVYRMLFFPKRSRLRRLRPFPAESAPAGPARWIKTIRNST